MRRILHFTRRIYSRTFSLLLTFTPLLSLPSSACENKATRRDTEQSKHLLTLNKPRQPLSVHKKQKTKQLQCTNAQSKQDREELEYALASDKRPYKASTHSRFDNPECTAIFGSVLRQLLIRKGVSAVFSRQGYEADLKMIAKASSEDCVEALCAAAPDRQRSLDQLAYAPNVPEHLRKALRQVLFAQVNVPFTDGYRRNLRHEGHNLNAVHGPLKIFMTANFADVYSPVMLSMCLADGDGNHVANPIEVPWTDLAKQCPNMCTLQDMHRFVAQHPRTQAKFWLLMDDLVDRHPAFF